MDFGLRPPKFGLRGSPARCGSSELPRAPHRTVLLAGRAVAHLTQKPKPSAKVREGFVFHPCWISMEMVLGICYCSRPVGVHGTWS